LETKFRPNRGFLYLAAILYLGYHGNGRHLKNFKLPKAATYYGGYSYKVDHNMATKPWISNSQHQNLLGNQISPKSEDFCILAAIPNQRWISIRNIIIYLEIKFRPNRRIFVFGSHFVHWLPWRRPPFIIFSTPQKLSPTTVDIPTKFHEVWWKESNFCLYSPFFVSMATAEKFVQPIPIFLAYLVPLDVDVVPIKFHQFLFGE
jgi:hypothetical protein